MSDKTDVVAWLRATAGDETDEFGMLPEGGIAAVHALHEAATEIERLRALVAHYEAIAATGDKP